MVSLSRYHCVSILLLVASSLTFAHSPRLTTDKNDGQQHANDYYYPSWQSVYPDMPSSSHPQAAVLQLFGQHGSNWTLSSTDGAYRDIPAIVPGDILSDLMNAGIIGDPYYDRNLWTQRRAWMGPYNGPHWNGTQRVREQRTRTWEYETKIPVHEIQEGTNYLLVMEGIKMGARITWNGVSVAPNNVTSQFLRYTLPIDAHVTDNKRSHHALKVIFDPSISTGGRFMGCSGGWDWAPYAWEADERGSRVLTFGIVNPIYIVPYESVLITDVTPQISYMGDYPRDPLFDGPNGNFIVSVTIRVSWPQGRVSTVNQVRLESDFSNASYTQTLTQFSEETTVKMTASDVKLWWPNGLGEQPLYNIEVSLCTDGKQVGPIVRKRIGFRTLALVTANDTDDAVLRDMIENDMEGSGNHGMLLRINGAPIWSRGANVIPMDQLEGRITGDAARRMVQSAAKANMNMLRVWGGGHIPPKEFYEACDEEGIMLYHDLMFVEEENHGANAQPIVGAEIQHIVRMLAAHPCIVLWNGCNECGYFGASLDVYESFVMVKVAQVDGTRPIWPSSPSAYGWEQGVRMLDGLPSGSKLKIRTTKGREIERHGPYVRGFSSISPSVNGLDRPGCNETMVPTNFTRLQRNAFGAGSLNFFVSEFGASVFSSFDSMSATLPRANWGVRGGKDRDECMVERFPHTNVCNGTNPMAERNYAADNRIEAYFGGDVLDEVGEDAFSLQLYQSMMAQVFWVKGQVEMMRARNSFGTLIWQLNENWPTGGWGALEYGPNRQSTNQLAGGRWKPLMHVFQRTSFKDVTVCCGADNLCYAVNDSFEPTIAKVIIEAWDLSSSRPLRSTQKTLSLSGLRQIKFFVLPEGFSDGADLLLLSDAEDNPFDVVLTVAPKHMSLRDTPCTAKASLAQPTIILEVTCPDIALYVWLSSAAEGWFSDNAFHLRPGSTKTILFSALPGRQILSADTFLKTLRVLHLGSKGKRTSINLQTTSLS